MKIRMNKKRTLIVLISLLVLEATLTGFLPQTTGMVFHNLEIKSSFIWVALALYFGNNFILNAIQAIKNYVVTKLSMLFRTERTLNLVLDPIRVVENVNQRIQEDIKLSYMNRITVYSEYFISGLILIQLVLLNIDYPILIAAALVYAAISVWIALLFNPKLTHSEKEVQKEEATFRNFIGTHLMFANAATLYAAKVRMHYLLFTKVQLSVMSILPFVVLVPQVLSGAIDIGTLMLHQSTFSLLVLNAAILIQFYPLLIQGHASEQRVRELV